MTRVLETAVLIVAWAILIAGVALAWAVMALTAVPGVPRDW